MDKIIKRILFVLLFITLFVVTFLNICYTSNISMGEVSEIHYNKLSDILIIGIVNIIIVLLVYLLGKLRIRRTSKIIIIALAIVLYMIFQLIWINTTPMEPCADSEQILKIAKCILGKNEWHQDIFNYIQYYPQQLTLSVIIAMIFKIFNTTNYLIIQIINMLSNVLTILGLYAILKEMKKKYMIRESIFFIISLTYIPLIMLVTYVYGDIMGLACSVWAVYFAIRFGKELKIRYAIYTIVLMMIAYLLKMNYVIFSIAIVIYWIISFIEYKIKDIKKIMLNILLIIMLILAIILPSKILKNIFFSKFQLSEEKSFSIGTYLYMGMSEGERANGWYNLEIERIVKEEINYNKNDIDNSPKDINEKLLQRSRYLLTNPLYTFKFYIDKIITIWAEPTMEYNFYNKLYTGDLVKEENPILFSILYGDIYKGTRLYQKAINLMIFIGSIIIVIANRKKIDKEIIFIGLIFLGGFSFHILWEGKSRYILPYIVILIPISCIGITMIINKVEEIIKNIKPTKRKEDNNEKDITSNTNVL